MVNPVSTNPIGQILDDVGEKLADTFTEPVKDVATEPAKILEQILGGAPQTEPLEQGQGSAPAGTQDPGSSDLAQKKKADEQYRAEKLHQIHLQLHQERQKEEREHYAQSKQEEAMNQQQEQQEEQEEKREEIMQLERRKEAVMAGIRQGNMGGSQEQMRKRE